MLFIRGVSGQTLWLLTVIGGYLTLMPNGVSWYWGNMSIYVYSYFHNKNHSSEHSDVKAPWLLSIYTIGMSLAVILSGYINNKLGRRPTIALGIALFDGGLLASYFVFDFSMSLLDVTMGLFCGVGTGLMHALILQTIVEWTTSHLGFMAAFLFSSYALGSIITNQIITRYLNPNNWEVDVIIGKSHFFSQKEILDKVPSMFLALSIASTVFHVFGFCLVRIKPYTVPIDATDSTNKTTDGVTTTRKGNQPKLRPVGSSDTLNKLRTDGGYQSNYESMKDTSEWLESVGSIPGLGSIYDGVGAGSLTDSMRVGSLVGRPRAMSLTDSLYNLAVQCEKSPRQVLKTKFFYIIWFMLFGSDSAYMTLSNYYKVFGQVWIKDDHFLTNLGTFYAIVTVMMRLVWGIMTDFVGIKPALVTLASGLSLVSVGYFFTASIDKWLFFAATLLIGCINCGVYINFIVAMNTLYGTLNFTKNYGMLASATILLNLAFPPLTKLLLGHVGWFWLYFSIGFVNFCALVLVVTLLPEQH